MLGGIACRKGVVTRLTILISLLFMLVYIVMLEVCGYFSETIPGVAQLQSRLLTGARLRVKALAIGQQVYLTDQFDFAKIIL